ncbi:hypothetical protein D3C80_910020 [compost metagenome]
MGVNIVLLPALDARGQGAVDFRARDFRRAEAVALGIGHPVDGDVQAGVAGSVVFHGGDDHAVPECANHLSLRLQHLAGHQDGSVALKVNAGRSVQLPLVVNAGIKGTGFGFRLRVRIVPCSAVRLRVAVVLSGGNGLTAHADCRIHRRAGVAVVVVPGADPARHHLMPG